MQKTTICRLFPTNSTFLTSCYHFERMNVTSSVEENWYYDIQFGNTGAVLFIVAYIGFYGLSIICLFGQQLKETQRQRHELPAYFLKSLWDVPNKNKLYQELADVERLKRIFRGYFADHESYLTTRNDDLQAMVDERAHACASRYRQKLRRLHLSHTDYYLDTAQRYIQKDNDEQRLSKVSLFNRASLRTTVIGYRRRREIDHRMLSISVV